MVETPPPLNAKLDASPKTEAVPNYEAVPAPKAPPSFAEIAARLALEPAPRNSKLAVASFVTGLLSLVCCLMFILGIPSLVMGVISLRMIQRQPRRLKGKGFAIAGIILGGLSTLVTCYSLFMNESQNRSKYLRTLSDMRSISRALGDYRLDEGVYPPFLEPHLTTPVSYHSSGIHWDNFSEKPLVYYQTGDGWILFSMGPDGFYQIHPDEDYDPELRDNPALTLKTYDATNGTWSKGDIFLVK
jgi:hypothetical protein